MNFKSIYFLICVLLVVVGVIFGQMFHTSNDNLDSLIKVLSMVANVATLFGVIVAYLALHAWKEQYKHNKLDTLIDTLEDDFGRLYRAMSAHRNAELFLEKYRANAGSAHNVGYLNDQCVDKLDQYLKTRGEYGISFNKLNRHHKLSQESILSAYIISIKLVPILQDLTKVYKEPNSDDLLLENSAMLENLWILYCNEFKTLRGKVLLTSC
ncbi:hypothetical protein [Colwellia sp. C1TZA3]|uniref:hypothetical protein n=1 Tax=Colwellia sp. C1TZA3 TaxID=2508879 RepID=UPI0011B9A917|nr:hypothetical protein [Colwellia sp. C1TZA3]TWX64216.1 hypothetical protein ESZ39_16290 [Colwellia sp. C1TZA3]